MEQNGEQTSNCIKPFISIHKATQALLCPLSSTHMIKEDMCVKNPSVNPQKTCGSKIVYLYILIFFLWYSVLVSNTKWGFKVIMT